MIHLDSNYLISGVKRTTPEASAIQQWLLNGEILACSTITWSEFLNGPVTPAQVATARAFLTGGCADFEEAHAERAADLFNRIGRLRRLKFDCLIAASAIVAGAELATGNATDFRLFVPHGLKLAP